MAIDQRDVSSALRFMKDDVLRQYAAMHKNDPYIFPLAFQESQNRQRLRMQQQTAQAMQPQPKVNEQALAQMAPPRAQPMPEDRGIATLAAPNMQQMADGGIAGYDDDANFAQRSEPVVMMAGGGHVPRYQGNPRDGSLVRMPYGGDTMGMPDPTQEALNALQAEEAGATRARTRKIAELEQQVAFLTAAGAPQAATVKAQLDALKAPAPFKGTMPEAGYTYKGMENDPRLNTPPSKPVGAAPKVDATRRNTADPSAVRKEPAADKTSEPTGLDALVKQLTRETDLAQGALRNQRVGLASQLEQEALGTKEEGEKRRKERGDVFASREARLAEREKGVAGLSDKYMGLALLQAGAAMMSTPGNLGSVIGKGIQVGSERYIAGIDKINAAKDKFAEARDRLDELRLNRDDMNEKEIKEENRAIRTARIQGQQLLTEGATKDLEMTTANMREFFKAGADAIQTDKRITSAENIARMQERGATARSLTPDKLVFDQLTKQYGGDTVKAAEALQKMKTEKFNVYDAYSKYLQAFAGKDTLKGPDDFEVFAKRFIPTVTPGKNTPIRTQPGG